MTFSELYTTHHASCDTAFADAEAAGVEARWDEAAPAMRRFSELLFAHFAAEEDALFPAFEARMGSAQGPTTVMRMEHAHMRELVEGMNRAIAAHDTNEFAGAAETLLVLMQQHNMKEERILYPACDRALAGDAELLARTEALIAR